MHMRKPLIYKGFFDINQVRKGRHMRDIERYDARSSLRRWKNASSTSRRKT